ncbi:phosphatidylserine decarboxylase [Pisolithus orientalis]|uniref:phosphatidylserine decarboxylase n=1 Tax=Pisolithus orientalis TaxID=936130 RepID=UPI002225AF1D|nr:phosphatidylserine decarboxylase [Pisolithus orientalis]KAI5993779.1 phosphatidylserine decarboxylase [Pisolithus orientalis]
MLEMPVISRSRHHGWLLRNPENYNAFLGTKISDARHQLSRQTGAEHKHSKPVQQFAHPINKHPTMKKLFGEIFSNYVPAYLVFDMLSNTSAAYDLFPLNHLLNCWGKYLHSPGSNSTLNTGEDGWFNPKVMEILTSGLGPLSFEQTYVCPDPNAENKSFQLWDAFIREVRPQARPVRFPDDPYFIHNACESTTLQIATNVKLHDTFWLKDHLYDMLGDNEEYALPFVGGTKAYGVEGSHYVVLPDEGAPQGDYDLEPGDPYGALIRSQPWLTVSATRALIFIEADEPVGLICFIGVGMAEVSTCALSVNDSDTVVKGQEIGMCHFGGSSVVLIFSPEVKIRFEDIDEQPITRGRHYWVNTLIGRVTWN